MAAIPPVKRIAEQYVAESESPGYAESQQSLLTVVAVVAGVCLPLIALGFVL